MAKFCSSECRRTGSLCDFCTNFIADTMEKDGRTIYIEIGTCAVTGLRTDRCEGYRCSYFECFNVKRKKEE